ncbi:hypothetical protein MRX96_013819 [Rhipicephalus microplus]
MSSRKQHEEHLVRRGIHDRRSSHHDADLTNPYDEAEDQTDRAENVSTDEEPLKQESDVHKPYRTEKIYPELRDYKRRLSIPRTPSPSRRKKEPPLQNQKVATALSYTFDDGGDYGTIAADELSVSEDVARHIIENRCKEVVEMRQRHIIVASHLEQWNPDAAMMLHPLCDQENALYKNVTYILTVFTRHEDVSGQRERKEYDRLAENALNNAWESMDTNQRHAIISRKTLLKQVPFPI